MKMLAEGGLAGVEVWGDAGQGREGGGYCPVPPLIPRSGLSQIHD